MHPLRPTTNRRFNELVGLLILVAAALLLLALVSYHPADPSWDTAARVARPANWVGPVGATLADVLFQLFGLASFLLVLGLGALARNWFCAPRSRALHRSHVIGLLLSMVAVAALLGELPRQLLWRGSVPLHGLIGLLVASALIAAFNPVGAYVITATALLAGLFLTTRFSFAALQAWWSASAAPRLLQWFGPILRPLTTLLASWRNWRAQRAARKLAERAKRPRPEPAPLLDPPTVHATFIPAHKSQPEPETAAARARRAASQVRGDHAEPPRAEPEVVALPAAAASPVTIHMRELAPTPAAKAVRLATGQYKTPPLSLLQPAPPGNAVEEAELRDMAQRLTAKCEEFSVGGQVTQINPGPVVTTYEFKPEAGVKYSRITALNDDLCLALAAESVYIERIPGKSTVGIEVPNPHRETIFLREIIASEAFQHSKSPLTMALGKDANGAIVVTDLAAMPHLLIAGSTGSGKSVALNSM
ncbi:MAG: DNA translocase FtsK 4TM domain-containing protein, partial [Terriglobales bacterium]